MIKMDEIKKLPPEELKIRLRDAEEELINLKFQDALSQLDNPLQLRYLKRSIARMKTILREYELGIRESVKPQA